MPTPKTNVAYELYLALKDSVTGRLKANPTIAAGDFKISTDGGAFGNLATLPVVTPAGSIAVKVSLSAAEMNGDKIILQAIDAVGSEWDDCLMFFDADVTNINVNVVQIAESSNPITKLALSADTMVTGTITAGGTSTLFVTDLASAVDDYYKGGVLIPTGGALENQRSAILAYTGATKTIQVGGFTSAPGNDPFIIV